MLHVLRKASMRATGKKTLMSKSCWVTMSLPFCPPGIYRVSTGKKGGKKSSTTIITINNIHNVQRDGTERRLAHNQTRWVRSWLGAQAQSGLDPTQSPPPSEELQVCPETCPLSHLYQ